MAGQKNRPIDALQRIMTSMKTFEKKLDKLQEDVSVHGQALTDLRGMVANLSGGTILNASPKSPETRWNPRKTTVAAVQYEEKTHLNDLLKHKSTPAPLAAGKLNPPSPQRKSSPASSPHRVQAAGKPKDTSPKPSSPKHSHRHRKTDAHRKANEKRAKRKLGKTK